MRTHVWAHVNSKISKFAAGVLVLVLACLGLAACGESATSSSSSASTSVAAKAATAGGTSSGPAGHANGEIGTVRRELEKHDTVARACLQKQHIALPTLGVQVSSNTPKGMTHTQYEALVNKCGGHIENPLLRQAFAKFATCMRANGVNFPTPNTSGKGPIFSAKGINTASPAYRAAATKCRSVLSTAFRASAGTRGGVRGAPGGTSGSTGAAGSAGSAKTPPPVRPKIKVPPAVTKALQKFTACMRENGVTSFPEPEGASFNVSHVHLDTKSAQYKAAEKKCEPILQAAFK
jgi:hypothetical protein